MAKAVLAAIDAAGAADRVIVESFDLRVVRAVRGLRPDIARAWLTAPDTAAAAPLWWGVDTAAFGGSTARAVAAEGGRYWAPQHRSLTRAELRAAHAEGLRVLPWTVNDPDDMRRLIDWGVDGLITDYPDRALRILGTP
jgi:glycerophosphoryl diester phosphodiesterase